MYIRISVDREDIAAELEFHEHLVRVTGNPVLMEFASFFNRFFQEAYQLVGTYLIEPQRQRMEAQEHLEVVKALKVGQIEHAKMVAERSIRRWQEKS